MSFMGPKKEYSDPTRGKVDATSLATRDSSGKGRGNGLGKGLHDVGLSAGFTAEQLAGFDAVGEDPGAEGG